MSCSYVQLMSRVQPFAYNRISINEKSKDHNKLRETDFLTCRREFTYNHEVRPFFLKKHCLVAVM